MQQTAVCGRSAARDAVVATVLNDDDDDDILQNQGYGSNVNGKSSDHLMRIGGGV